MSAERSSLEAVLARLADAARSGNRAKRQLARKLASMSPAQLQTVSPEAFVRLGPEGLKMFASAAADMSDVAPPDLPIRKSASRLELIASRWHFANPLFKCLAVTVVCGALGVSAASLSRPILNLVAYSAPKEIQGWPICTRLDRGDRGCVYQARSHTLTLDRIATMTRLSPESLVEWNRHIDFRFRVPRGAWVVIPRRGLRW